MPAADAMDLLGRLVDKSLVVVGDSLEQGQRYCLLEMVRQYSRDRLEERGEDGDVRARHRARFLALSEDARAGRGGLDPGAWPRTWRPNTTICVPPWTAAS